MHSWLAGGAPLRSRHWVTDDPLATIAAPATRPAQVYAVTRVNPIFVEEDGNRGRGGRGGRGVSGCSWTSCAGGGGSSGYDSQRSSQSSEGGPGGAEEALEAPHPWRAVLPPLAPIPEGRVDYCIPRPVWPRYEVGRRPRDGRRKMGRRRGAAVDGDAPYRHLLRELHAVISRAEPGAAELVLRDVDHKITRTLEVLEKKNEGSEVALRQLSESLSRSEAVVGSLGRALNRQKKPPDLEAGHITLLHRLGRFPAEPVYDLAHAQGSTSSSATFTSTSTSSSGFSDLTPSPPSSASGPPVVFLHDDPTCAVPTRVRNAMLYETLRGYEKLRPHRKVEEDLDQQWTICEKKPPEEKVDKGISVYPGVRTPDFTLDGPQAELLVRRLQSAKRQRRWCRLLTTAVAAFFFLFSVVVVSMALTKGKRMFGSL